MSTRGRLKPAAHAASWSPPVARDSAGVSGCEEKGSGYSRPHACTPRPPEYDGCCRYSGRRHAVSFQSRIRHQLLRGEDAAEPQRRRRSSSTSAWFAISPRRAFAGSSNRYRPLEATKICRQPLSTTPGSVPAEKSCLLARMPYGLRACERQAPASQASPPHDGRRYAREKTR